MRLRPLDVFEREGLYFGLGRPVGSVVEDSDRALDDWRRTDVGGILSL